MNTGAKVALIDALSATNTARIQVFAVPVGVVLAVGLSVHLVHAYWPHEKRQEHTDFAGFIFGGVAALYSVLLAFMVVVGWEGFNSADATTYTEANQLASVYGISRSLPLPQGAVIEGLTLKYAHTVIDKEWPLMDKGQSSQEAQALLFRMRDEVFAFKPQPGRQQALYEQAVVSVNDLYAARLDRLGAMRKKIPRPLWEVLVIGGVLTLGLGLTFAIQSKIVHIGMVGAYAVLITVSLLLIMNMQHPFTGQPHVDPEAFEVFLRGLPTPR